MRIIRALTDVIFSALSNPDTSSLRYVPRIKPNSILRGIASGKRHRKRIRVAILALISFPLLVQYSYSATSVSQRGVTFHFSTDRPVGRFVNGDYWVLAPVTIVSIDPPYSEGQNGWMINPICSGDGGRCGGHSFCAGAEKWDSTLLPTLPHTNDGSAIESIVKTVYNEGESCVADAVVLTILPEIPPDNGATVFRPPWLGTKKPLYRVQDLKLERIPSHYTPVDDTPSLAEIASQFSCFRLDYFSRFIRPTSCMDSYTPANAGATNSAMLRLMLKDRVTDPNWWPAFCNFTQYAIDTAYAIYYGFRVVTGHTPAYPAIAAWAVTLLEGHGEMDAIRDVLQNITDFSDFQYTSGAKSIIDGRTLWGQENSEYNYWSYIVEGRGNRSNADPYHYIDGGVPWDTYALIVAEPYKGNILVFELAPALKNAINQLYYESWKNFVERWVSHGLWYQPDPCAPYPYTPFSRIWDGYGVTWGPDGTGGCIKDSDLDYYNGPADFACRPGRLCGRFPSSDGMKEAQYRNKFVDAMWRAYYGQTRKSEPPQPPRNLRLIR